jgi:hypothetical protein
MPKKKRLGHGSTVSINGSAFGMLMKFKPHGVSREFVDTTCLEDTVVNGLDSDPVDYGTITGEGMWDHEDTGDQAIETFIVNDDQSEREGTLVCSFRKTGTGTAPAASTWTYTTYTYTGRFLKLERADVESKGKLTLSWEFRITAAPVKA